MFGIIESALGFVIMRKVCTGFGRGQHEIVISVLSDMTTVRVASKLRGISTNAFCNMLSQMKLSLEVEGASFRNRLFG